MYWESGRSWDIEENYKSYKGVINKLYFNINKLLWCLNCLIYSFEQVAIKIWSSKMLILWGKWLWYQETIFWCHYMILGNFSILILDFIIVKYDFKSPIHWVILKDCENFWAECFTQFRLSINVCNLPFLLVLIPFKTWENI